MVKKIIFLVALFIGFIFFLEGKVSAQNAFDAEEKKTGPWIITGDISRQEGFDDTAKVEEGE